MFDETENVVSEMVASSGELMTSGTTKESDSLNSNDEIKTSGKSSRAEQLTDLSHKLKSAKKIFDFVKIDTIKSINKARNLRKNALKKANQAEEILRVAKEDWETKVITATKKINEFKSNPGNLHLKKQANQAIENVNQAKENFKQKKNELTKKRNYLQKCEENLEFTKLVQKRRIKWAEIAYMRFEMEQQKTIQSTDDSTLGWGVAGKTHYKR